MIRFRLPAGHRWLPQRLSHTGAAAPAAATATATTSAATKAAPPAPPRPTHRQWSAATRLIALATVGATICAHAGPLPEVRVASADAAQQSWDLVAERMQWMPAVAHWKTAHGVPVEDLQREAVVLGKAREQAQQLGLRGDGVLSFMQLQMDLAKQIQRRVQQRQQPPATVPDLNGEIRPAIIRIGNRWLRQLAIHGVPTGGPGPQVRQRLRDLGLRTTDIQALATAVGMIRPAPPTAMVARIRARGVLRVGSTGDYAPFSLRDGQGGRWTGIDVAAAQRLAASLAVDLLIIPTSWPSLMDDLGAQRFDVAMSGVSRTLPRARTALFSDAYHSGGKMPIARCAERDRYTSLQQIDQPGVRVVVNPGGTNERFVTTHLQAATIVRYPDNRKIFDQVRSGAADLMITDAIEVRLQSGRHPDLCATRDRPFNHQTKGYLLPMDSHWQAYINLWLSQLRGSGDLGRLFARELGEAP